MSRLNELTRELCPEGVEYKPLSDVLKIKNGKDYKKYGSGDIPVYGSGGIMTYIDTYVYNKPSVLIPRKGSLDKLYYVDTPFWTVDTIFYTVIDESQVMPRYVYHYLLSQHLERLNKAGGVPSLTQTELNGVEIPVPPLEVQCEIVRILDQFTETTEGLVSNLTMEISLRKKQYEYYRDKLLTFDISVPRKTLEALCHISAGGDVPKDHFSKDKTAEHNIPIVSNGIGDNAIYGYTHIPKISEPSVTIAARGTIGYAEYRDYPYYPIIRLLSVTPKDTSELDAKYVYYCLQGRKYNIPTSGIPQLTIPMLKKVEIPVPEISIQKRLVNILDNFETICSDMKIAIPAEIAARKKQYEYYRDKLLSFPRKP